MRFVIYGLKVLLISLVFSSSCFARNMSAGHIMGTNLDIGFYILAAIDTEEGQSRDVHTRFKQGGFATTSSSDKVMWGYFYADPYDVGWGNPDNPDLYVKVWIDHTGRVDVNYFHVSVPNIRVETGLYDNIGKKALTGSMAYSTATMNNRYIQHRQYPGKAFLVQ